MQTNPEINRKGKKRVIYTMPKKNKKNSTKKVFIIFLPIVFVLILFVGIYLWYQSRAIPDLDEEHQVTILPTDVYNVLGTKIGPNTRAEVSIRIPVFLYHYVEYVHNDPGKQNLNIPPNILPHR